ncbi:hypothetical protein PhCBS80983_g02007 [Powellomyces hirtus]|uniref:GRIP domain-containing protein n=1 Tax=Powellomyces hirtus TaxID=109895 RepID=A0A507E7V9_9FUNG|nr:hypothetical protein PhCBS80983_g02007 [Powellomyces hirtus]
MFSNLGKALAASREALGTIQTAIKDQTGLDPLSARPSRTNNPSVSATNLFDAPQDDDGFQEQSLAGPTTNNSSENGADLMRFSDDRPSVDLQSGGAGSDSTRSSLDANRPSTTSQTKPAKAVPPPITGTQQPALSSMTPEQALSMDVTEMGERLARLRKFEAKFQDLARVYKQLQRKLQQVEGIISNHSPIPKITTTADLEALDAFLTSLREKQEVSVTEIGRLTRQVSEIREVQELEASTKADMFASLQAKLLEREEEINRLKHILQRTPPASPMPEPRNALAVPPISIASEAPSPTSTEGSVSLKLKVRELTNALTRVKEERDATNDRCRQLEESLAEREAMSQGQPVENGENKHALEEAQQLEAKVQEAEQLRAEAQEGLEKQKAQASRFEAECDALRDALKSKDTARENNSRPGPQNNMVDLMSDDPIPDATADSQNHSDASTVRVAELEKALHDAQTALDQATTNVSRLEANLAEHTKAKDDLFKQCHELERANIEYADGATRLQGELTSLKEDHQISVSERDRLNTRGSELESQLRECNLKLSKLEEEQTANRATLSEQQDAADEKERLADELSAAKKDLAERKQALEELTSERDMLKQHGNKKDKVGLQAEISRLKAQLAESEQKLAQLEKGRTDGLATIADLREQLSKSPVSDLESQLNSVTKKLEATAGALDAAQSELKSATEARDKNLQQVQTLEASVSERQANADRVQALMKAMREKLQTKITDLEQESNVLKEEEARWRARVSSMEGIAKEKDELQITMEALQSDLEEKGLRINDLEQRLSGAQNSSVSADDAGNAVPEKGKGRAKLEKQLVALRSEVAKLKAEAKDRNSDDSGRLQSIEKELSSAKAEVEAASQRITELEGSLKNVTEQRTLLDNEVKMLRELVPEFKEGAVANAEDSIERDAAAARISELEARIESLSAEKNTVEVALNASRDEKHVIMEQCKQLKDQLDARERTWKEQEDRESSILDETKAKLSELERTVETIKAEQSAAEQELSRLREEKEVSAAGSADSEAQIQTTVSRLRDVEKELADTRAELEQVNAQLASEQSDVQSLRKELNVAEHHYQTTLATVTDLTNRLSESEDNASQLEELTTEHAALKEQLKAANQAAENLAATEARADQLERDMKALTTVRRQLEQGRTETEQHLRTLEEQLALAKQAVHERDSSVHDLESEMTSIRTQLREEEEKKAKSIQLLRQSKARILKLEAESKAKDEAMLKVQEELRLAGEGRERDAKEKEQQLANVTRQIEDMQMRMRRQQEQAADLERQRHDFSVEREKIQQRMDELETLESNVRAERDSAWEELEQKQVELEGARSLLETREAQLSGEVGRWTDVEERMANMEHELETSKRLFQTKSTENDHLRLRVSELEAQLYEATQVSSRVEGDVDALRREARDAKKEVADKVMYIKRLEQEMEALRQERVAVDQALEELKAKEEEAKAEQQQLLAKAEETALLDSERKKRIAELKSQLEMLEAEKESIRKENEQALFNRDKLLEDMRIREGQFKNLNKTLKDEVRKLNRTASISGGLGFANSPASSSLQSPPPISRPSSTGSLSRHSHRGSIGSLGSDDSNLARRDSTSTTTRPSFPPRLQSVIAQESHAQLQQTPHQQQQPAAPPPPDEYLKAVLLKFLEAKDKRGQLLPVLGMLLRFSPDELKRVQKFA